MWVDRIPVAFDSTVKTKTTSPGDMLNSLVELRKSHSLWTAANKPYSSVTARVLVYFLSIAVANIYRDCRLYLRRKINLKKKTGNGGKPSRRPNA
ncbi:hypothetical protein Y032_0053g2412 [Ancylostoma ceylanicum]|uniref:Uncharacterized protein n=1 Tax=Ancylostoma ceylanicum TaxID=53326 RepID=A0A016U6P2_9BILA|nr:hypothetical protein Y032_0053g2412 [Ancylostoma ceylanicum]